MRGWARSPLKGRNPGALPFLLRAPGFGFTHVRMCGMGTEPRVAAGVDVAVAAQLQAVLDALNEFARPTYDAPAFLSSFRHQCAKARRGRTQSIDLTERYERHADGVHALIYREGTCAQCGQVARSTQGRVVLVAERPPLEGRVARE